MEIQYVTDKIITSIRTALVGTRAARAGDWLTTGRRQLALAASYARLALQLIRPLPDPSLAFREVIRELRGLEIAERNSRTLSLGAWNMEFLNSAKAEYFLDSYKEIVLRHHLLGVEEVNHPGLAAIGKACGYGYFISAPNSRGQAVGFLVHPRLRVASCIEYTEVARIYGIPDLRPALRLDLHDRTTDVRFSAVVVHLKSMCGGVQATSAVRHQQMIQLARCIGTVEEIAILLGDFNCFLGETNDTMPLVTDGYRLLNPWDRSATHHLGGRLDGLFSKNLPPTVKLGSYNIRNFWRNKLIGCALSDHGLLTWKMVLSESSLNQFRDAA
jgi:hypothetical protein